MTKTYLKLAVRKLLKNGSFTLINFIGLAFGFASIMTLLALVHQYYSTDDFQANRERLYYLKTFLPDGQSGRQTAFPLLDEIQRTCPEVKSITHYQQWLTPWLDAGIKSAKGNQSVYVDPDFLTIFSFGLREGDPQTALQRKFSIVISSAIKQQLFGNADALGQTISIFDKVKLTVTGVLNDIPVNSSLKPEVLLPIELLKPDTNFAQIANWYNSFAEGYLLVNTGADPTALNSKIQAIVKNHYSPETRTSQVKAVPFATLKKEGGPVIRTIITGSIASAFFILLIVVVNLLNLNFASLLGRTREVSIQRLVGASKKNVIVQYCLENSILVFTSLLFSFAIFKWLALPQVNTVIGSQFGGIKFSWSADYPVFLAFFLISILIILVAGSLPSWRLTAGNVITGAKDKSGLGGGTANWGRNIFITAQFVMAITFICITIILNDQVRFMKASPLGFNKENLIVANLDLSFKDETSASSRFQVLLNSMRNDPNIKTFSTSPVIPTAYMMNYNYFADLDNDKEISVRQEQLGASFAPTYEVPIMKGRNFDDRLSATEGNKILVNETAVKAFGWSNPIGKKIKSKGDNVTYTVVGVLKDFHYGTLETPIEPLLHFYAGKPGLTDMNYLTVRVNSSQSAARIIATIQAAFTDMPSRRPFEYHFLGDLIDNQYALLDGILKVTNYVSAFAIFISSIGMLGLISIFARRRVREIGIRKVLGASVFNITALLTRQFLLLIVVAILIATPLAFFAMNKWLQDFAYRVSIGYWTFLLSGGIAILVAGLTVGYQTIKAAIANPITSLRNE